MTRQFIRIFIRFFYRNEKKTETERIGIQELYIWCVHRLTYETCMNRENNIRVDLWIAQLIDGSVAIVSFFLLLLFFFLFSLQNKICLFEKNNFCVQILVFERNTVCFVVRLMRIRLFTWKAISSGIRYCSSEFIRIYIVYTMS